MMRVRKLLKKRGRKYKKEKKSGCMILAIIISLLATASCSSISSDPAGYLAFKVPEYSTDGKLSLESTIFAVTLLFAISFINIPKKSLQLFQSQITVLVGIYLGTEHILYSLGISASMLNWIIGIASLVATVLSFNEDFRSIFLASICSYITVYYGVLMFRVMSIFNTAVMGGILFVIYLFFGRSKDRLLISVSKAGVTSLGIVALVDTWGIISLLGGMHGINGKAGFLYGFLIGGGIIFTSFFTVFALNYYPEWIENKIESIKTSEGASSK